MRREVDRRAAMAGGRKEIEDGERQPDTPKQGEEVNGTRVAKSGARRVAASLRGS